MQLCAEAGHGGYPRVDPVWALGESDIPRGEFWNGKRFWVTKEGTCLTEGTRIVKRLPR